MNMKLKSSWLISLTIVLFAAGVSITIIAAHAQIMETTSSSQAAGASSLVAPSELQYPIAVLGNCSSVSNCRDYCNVAAHQMACLAFAAQHNLMTQAAIARAQRLLALIQNGQTPGNCSTAQECRAYCSDVAHADECLNFAEQAGFISAAQANAIKQSHGQGPGGCTSAESCATFCNNPVHHSICLDFAQQNGLISEEQARMIQQSATSLRIGLRQFPGQVVQCLKNELGDNAVGELESGDIMPNASTSILVDQCLTAYRSQIQNRFQNLIQNASGTIRTCLGQITSTTLVNLTRGDLGALSGDEGEKVRECLSEMSESYGEDNRGSSTQNQERNLEQEMHQMGNQIQDQLDNLPDRVKNCVQPYLMLNPTSTNLGTVIARCLQQYGPTPAENAEDRGVIQGSSSPGTVLPYLFELMKQAGGSQNSQRGDH
jgi:hypothetical protein